MSLSRHALHRGETVRIEVVHCHPHDHACGPDEYSPVSTLAFPLRGVFLKHHSRRERVVADACHAIFFKANEPYRVSHPVAGGDDCLVIEPSHDVLRELLGAEEFRQTHAVLAPRLAAAARILRYRLARQMASALEAEETALDLLAATAATTLPAAAQRRQQDMVEATKITLAAQPGEPWSLAALARRVHGSPFYLARTFRRLTGLPLHRYHLQTRLAAALVEVLDSARDLSAIAADLGFSSHSHFTATFRKAFGATPATLRKEGKISTAG